MCYTKRHISENFAVNINFYPIVGLAMGLETQCMQGFLFFWPILHARFYVGDSYSYLVICLSCMQLLLFFVLILLPILHASTANAGVPASSK